MKKQFFYLSGLILVVFIASCRNRINEEFDSNGNRIIKEWYTKKKIKSVKILFSDSLNDYLYIKYNKKGSLLDSARYVNDSLVGQRKFYEDKTTLLHTENYSHGVLHGVHKATYPNGINGFEGFRKNNLMVGEWKFHFSNGHPITYEYYDSAGVMKYFRKYDNNGNVLKISGHGLIQVKSDLSLLDSIGLLRGFVEAAIPPECTTRFMIEDNLNAGLYLDIELSVPKTNWEIVFSEPGQKDLKYTIIIKDNKTGKTETSISEQKITVNPFGQ